MPIDNYEPVDHITLRTPETIAAYANPTRMAILSILAEEEATLSAIAARMGTVAANLSHQIRKLLEARLIVLVETRATARNVEKYYRASAYSYSIERAKPGSGSEGDAALLGFRDAIAAAAARRSKASGASFARMSVARIGADDARAFRARLEELVREFEAKDGDEAYALALALFPSGSAEKP